LVLHLPAPLTAPEVLLDGATASGFLWDAPGGPSFAGRGVAHAIEVRGPGRPAALRRQAEELFRSVETLDHPLADGPEPRLFGGLAFQTGGAEEVVWQPFGDGSFTLPRWLYARRGAKASLSLALRCAEEVPSPALRRELGEVLEALTTLPARRRGLPRAGQIAQMPRQEWARQVEAIRAAIRRQDFQKIVAARRARVELEGPLDPLALLQRLRAHQDPSCRRFAFFRGRSAFLGATPERLILRRGPRIETEALAGSIGSGRQQATRLLESRKDQVEHALVVEHIVDSLRPVCSELEWSRQPHIRELKNLLHLNTPIRGCLREPIHVLELVERLHPTPAVGGVPAAQATRWIAEHESHPRGWYAGPIGWFTASGDGEFDVALRSCLLTGSTALLYAGAGIMLDSDPDLEYQETDLKQRSLLAALGVGG
jgi:menaquinone-specific isochorismate synthase